MTCDRKSDFRYLPTVTWSFSESSELDAPRHKAGLGLVNGSETGGEPGLEESGEEPWTGGLACRSMMTDLLRAACEGRPLGGLPLGA